MGDATHGQVRWDTGQSPHYDVVYDGVEALVECLVARPHRIVRNPMGPGDDDGAVILSPFSCFGGSLVGRARYGS